MIDVLRNCPVFLGIERLDEQRLELHRLLWGLVKTLESDPKGAQAEFRFNQLASQTTEHYRTEEDFMQIMGFPDLASHRIEHEKILNKFQEHMAGWHAPDSPPLIDLVEAFAELVQKHSKMMDRAFMEWLEAHGVNP